MTLTLWKLTTLSSLGVGGFFVAVQKLFGLSVATDTTHGAGQQWKYGICISEYTVHISHIGHNRFPGGFPVRQQWQTPDILLHFFYNRYIVININNH